MDNKDKRMQSAILYLCSYPINSLMFEWTSSNKPTIHFLMDIKTSLWMLASQMSHTVHEHADWLYLNILLLIFNSIVKLIVSIFLMALQVQSEIKRKWRRWHMQRFLGTNTKFHQPSLASNGSTSHTQITMLTKCSPTTHRISAYMDDFSTI